MVWFIIFVVVALVVWIWLQSQGDSARPSRSLMSFRIEAPDIKFTTIYPNDIGLPNVGELVAAGERAWILNPRSVLPLTLCAADEELAHKLKHLLSAERYWLLDIPAIALLIAQHNLRFKEVDLFTAQYRSRFTTEVAGLIAHSTEWREASERDRQDLRAEFEITALEALRIDVGQADLACLLRGEPVDFAEDDELLSIFGGDSSLYSFFLCELGRKGSVRTVKADDHKRRSWEQLVEMGLARRGKEIPLDDLLDGLRVKDINELMAGTFDKVIRRKAKAIEAALSIPDLESRLSARISYREMFQVVTPPGVEKESLGRSFAYATALAHLVAGTYNTGLLSLEALAERERSPEDYDAWEICHWKNELPPCARLVCKKYDKLPARLPPFHLGCGCQLGCTRKDWP